MNSIVYTHVFAPTNGASPLDVTLDRLRAYRAAELDSLEALLNLADPDAAAEDIAALSALHLDAGSTRHDVERLLTDAQAPLERLLERLRAISVDVPLAGPAPREFDGWLRWTGARLEDILSTIRHGLTA